MPGEFGSGADALKQHRAEAEEAADALATAWQLAGLPTEPHLMALPEGRGILEGPCVVIGACNARVARALADVLTEYARLTGRLVDGRQFSLLRAAMLEAGVRPALPADGFTVISQGLNT